MYFMLRDQDNAIIRPLPKIKRMIGDSACLPHIVQVSVGFHFLHVHNVNQIIIYCYFVFPAAFDL